MAVKIRLARRGRKKLALYDIVVADSRSPRDGRFIEKVGTYNPNTNPATIVLDDERVLQWVMTGAQPTDTTRAILSYRGLMFRKHLQMGVNKGAITQEQADERFNAWKEGKEGRIQTKVGGLADKKAADTQARLEAERKVNEARAEARRQREAEALAAANPPAEAASTEEASAEGEAPAEEAPQE